MVVRVFALLLALGTAAHAELISGGSGSGGGGGGTPGGSNTQIQYNNNGVFGGITPSISGGCAGVASSGTIGVSLQGTISSLELVNPQIGTTYTVNNADCGELTTFNNGSAVTVTIPQANTSSQFISGWFADYTNYGAGTVTFQPTTSKINNGASTYTLAQGASVRIVSDGTDYQVTAKGGASGGITIATTTITGGSSGNVLYNNAGVVGEMTTTGSGTVLALATSPSFTTPTLGVATATTINKVTLTAPATAATLTIVNNKTLTVNNSLTLAGTDATTMTFPGASDTVAGLGTVQTFSVANTFSVAGAISTPAVKVSGTWLTSTAATVAQTLIQASGANAFAGSAAGTGLGVNSASGFTGNLLDLQQNGSSVVSVNFAGTVTGGGFNAGITGFVASSASTALKLGVSSDAILGWRAAANFRFGAADAASPIAQTISFQGTATTNTAGVNTTFNCGGFSAGTGTSGDCIFATGGSGASSGTQNAAVTALTIKGASSTAGSGGAVITAAAIADSGFGYATPSTGGTVTLANSNYHQIIDPAGTLATLTVNMPPNPINGQFVDVRFSQVITALTVSGNGNSISGNPTSAAVGAQFGCIFRTTNTTWYC